MDGRTPITEKPVFSGVGRYEHDDYASLVKTIAESPKHLRLQIAKKNIKLAQHLDHLLEIALLLDLLDVPTFFNLAAKSQFRLEPRNATNQHNIIETLKKCIPLLSTYSNLEIIILDMNYNYVTNFKELIDVMDVLTFQSDAIKTADKYKHCILNPDALEQILNYLPPYQRYKFIGEIESHWDVIGYDIGGRRYSSAEAAMLLHSIYKGYNKKEDLIEVMIPLQDIADFLDTHQIYYPSASAVAVLLDVFAQDKEPQKILWTRYIVRHFQHLIKDFGDLNLIANKFDDESRDTVIAETMAYWKELNFNAEATQEAEELEDIHTESLLDPEVVELVGSSLDEMSDFHSETELDDEMSADDKKFAEPAPRVVSPKFSIVTRGTMYSASALPPSPPPAAKTTEWSDDAEEDMPDRMERGMKGSSN